jgi:ring-1,2-phenylacetyl-CoA epoxidase subunit PaaC
VTVPTVSGEAVAYVLRLGDDALVAAQRMAALATWAPQLEEDVALANIALDLLGQARALLTYAGELEGQGRDEDLLAYRRDEQEFTNALLVEQPDTDFAATMAKLLFFSAYQRLLYEELSTGDDETLAAIAAKSVKEVAYHLSHASAWTVRLGDGTDESKRRMQAAVDDLWPYTHELFESDSVWRGYGFDPAGLRERWLGIVEPVLAEATLARPVDDWAPTGGRNGLHTEHFGYLVGEMQSLHRAHEGVSW